MPSKFRKKLIYLYFFILDKMKIQKLKLIDPDL